jgi:hypothetical protein
MGLRRSEKAEGGLSVVWSAAVFVVLTVARPRTIRHELARSSKLRLARS